MRCSEVRSNLGPFVLSGLEPEEEAEIRRHLALCPSCREELEGLEKVSQALTAAPPPVDPPSYLKGAILSRVRAETLSSSRERGSKIRHLILPTAAASALVAIIALGILFGWQTESPVVTTVQLIPSPELREELQAEGEDYWGVAELRAQPLGKQQVELKLNNLEESNPGSFYELWFVSGESYISAGRFTIEGLGETNVYLSAPPETRDYRTLLITDEPADNETAPSEKVILKGEVP